ncbi:MAG: hypothetical protein ACFN0X_09325, partial [Mitsuokella sp.]
SGRQDDPAPAGRQRRHGRHLQGRELGLLTARLDAEGAWLASISPEIPLHLSRYFPRYRTEIPGTPVETLQELRAVAQKHLRRVHLGNV